MTHIPADLRDKSDVVCPACLSGKCSGCYGKGCKCDDQYHKDMNHLTNKVKFKSGATGTKGHRYELIPKQGLACAADRFELGLEKHPQGCYNALTSQAPLEDIDWLIARAAHAVEHLYNIIHHLRHGDMQDAYGDAGAVSFAGLIIGEAITHDRLKREKENPL